MTKLEQVINGLLIHMKPNVCVEDDDILCPYFHDANCYKNLMADAVKLLEEQEPVKPVFDAGDGKTIGQFLCGKCHAKIGLGHPHFCWYCGQAVKWDA